MARSFIRIPINSRTEVSPIKPDLLLFSGLNQLLWYYAEAERKKCPLELGSNSTEPDSNACTIWRRFSKASN
nr:unnamed protein product [Callosobruchus chinensis]